MATISELPSHSAARTIVDSLASNPDIYDELDLQLAELRRDVVTRPVVYVGVGTCGLGAGAGQTIQKARAFLTTHGIDAEVVGVGCIGLCAAEPLVDVQLPGRTRLCFSEVTAEQIESLLEQVFAGAVPAAQLLGQHRHPTLDSYPGLPFLDEHPFFAPQTRWVLANCGLIDPDQIDEYIAREGYRAMGGRVQPTGDE